MVLASKVFHLMSCGSAKLAVFSPPASLKVHRSIFPVATSSEYPSDGDLDELSENPRSLLCEWNRKPPISPEGIPATVWYLRVAVLSRYSLLTPSSFVTNARVLPSSLKSRSSTSHLISEVR